MKIKFLGTAAYDAVPSPFCRCKTCLESRALGGRNLRTRSQALINDDLLMDFNPDTISHFLRYGIDTEKINTCLITHSHCDHLYPDDILIPMYGTDPHRVDYYAGEAGVTEIQNCIRRANTPILEEGKLGLELAVPFRPFEADGYRILPLEANHNDGTSPMIYAIENDGKKMLYGLDSGLFPQETVDALADNGHLDLAVMDCTGGTQTKGWKINHMALYTVRQTIDLLRQKGVVDDRTVVVLNHFSHNGGATYDQMVETARADGFLVAYDGMELTV